MTRLSSVTVGELRRIPPWRLVLAGLGVALALLAVSGARAEPGAIAPRVSVARALLPGATAVRIPHTWLAATPPRSAPGDRVDLIGSRPADRTGGVVTVATDARILELESEAVVLELAPEDAAALAAAHASGYALLVLVRASR